MREPNKSRKSAWWRVRAACTALGRDRNGSVFFYTTLALPVLVGFALLAIDGSRLMNLHSHLQHGADGLALAAAGELAGEGEHNDDGHLERAKLAIQELIKNNQRFGDAGAAIIECPDPVEDCDVSGRFLTSLPPDDAIPISDWIAEDPNRLVASLSDDLEDHPRSGEARFVEVTVNPQGLTTLMPAALIGGSNTAAASATAVAGYTKGLCFFSPMMMCNPFEGSTPDLYGVAADPNFRRRMIEIRQVQSGNASYFPGNFAFLRTSYGDGADALQQAIAMVDPGTCDVQDGVDTKPGQNMGKVRRGINVRFGMYEGDTSGKKGDAAWRPSLNVRKGAVVPGDYCEPTLQSNDDYRGLPRDLGDPVADFGDGGRIFGGDWEFDEYWEANFGHAGIAPPNHPVVPKDPDGTAPVHPIVEEGQTPVPWSSDDPPSRYEVYRYEIETMVPVDPLDLDKGSEPLYKKASRGGETGEPICYTGGTLADDPDRRILHAAIVNCNDPIIKPKLKGASKGIPVYAFAKFFLIRPLDVGADTIDVELVDVASPPTDYQARDTVQLYR